uniref:Bone morphogenetic protein/retinoic acid inducible neural-specific 3a, tandem duplicate 1 n=1 Tax=Maylandia zebra TaxID=106582 RepID=A0A3P9CKD1_9CICH
MALYYAFIFSQSHLLFARSGVCFARSRVRDLAKQTRDVAKVHCNFFFSHVSCGAPFVSLPSGRRTGPLGCSNYDNLDSVSSVLVQSPENKIHLQGLQAILPEYLRARFVQAALSYIGCNEEGQFVCRNNDCWCQCAVDYPQCNYSWNMANQEFEESDEFQNFVRRLPTFYAMNASAIQYFWKTEPTILQRYKQLELSTQHLFTLSKRCQTQPKIIMLRERPFSYWLNYILSIMYCSENNHIGSYLEETRSCSCPYEHPPCQGLIPCTVGEGTPVRHAPMKSLPLRHLQPGYMLSQGVCRNEVPDSTDHYIGFETDLQDMELRYLLQKQNAADTENHSESWIMPIEQKNYPDWERTKLDLPYDCYNWTLTLGNKWKTFLRQCIFIYGAGSGLHEDQHDPGLDLQLDYPYTQGSQDSACCSCWRSGSGQQAFPTRSSATGPVLLSAAAPLKLSTTDVARIQAALQTFSAKQPNSMEYETTKLCS